MAKEEACGWCGEWYVKHGNQNYCSKECSRLAEKQREKLKNLKRRSTKKIAQSKPSLSIQDMVDLMLKLSKERGRVVQYGEVQKMILTGSLKVKGGACE
jgi:hypothetical protein